MDARSSRRRVIAGLITSALLVSAPAGARAATPDSWRAGPSMNLARLTPGFTTLADGRIFVAGGYQSGGTSTATTEIFSPSAGLWAPIMPMNTARQTALATQLADGRVLVAGPNNTAEVYTPGANTWADTANTMSDPRAGGSAFYEPYLESVALLPGGRVLAASGVALLTTPAILTSAEIYEPTTGTCMPIANMPQTALGAVGAALPSGEAFVIGGSSSVAFAPTATTLIYAPLSQTRQPASSRPRGPVLPRCRGRRPRRTAREPSRTTSSPPRPAPASPPRTHAQP
jgi:hypothetical protein